MNIQNRVGLALAINLILVSIWKLSEIPTSTAIFGYIVLVVINILVLHGVEKK